MKIFSCCMAALLMWLMGFCTGRLVEQRKSPVPTHVSNYEDSSYNTGYHYVSPTWQSLEVRGEHKYPLHVRDDGSVEIESGGNKMMVIVHPLKKEKP